MGGKPDNEEWDLNWEPPLHRVSRYKRRSDIKEVDITEFRVWIASTIHSWKIWATCFDLFVNTKHKVFTTPLRWWEKLESLEGWRDGRIRSHGPQRTCIPKSHSEMFSKDPPWDSYIFQDKWLWSHHKISMCKENHTKETVQALQKAL